MVAAVYSPGQLPLIEFIESDDLFLQDEPQALWFDVLRKLDYRQFQSLAARYYEQLWQFNQQQTQARIERRENPPAANPETQSQATARLLFGRATVVKGTGQMHWGHKASTWAFPGQEIFLDAAAMSDAAGHDSRSLRRHLQRLFERHPDWKGLVTRVLDDGAADDPELKAAILDHLTARGVPVCRAGYPFELLGVRHDTKHFLFAAPKDELGQSVCQGCDLREGCCRGQSGGRQITIPQAHLPWLDTECPQLSKRLLKAMARRTSIERMHKLMKWDLGDEQLTKRGNDAFQARLDKTLLAMHVLLAHDAQATDRPPAAFPRPLTVRCHVPRAENALRLCKGLVTPLTLLTPRSISIARASYCASEPPRKS